MKITQRTLIQILRNIGYKENTSFRHGSMGSGFYIQHRQWVEDCNTGLQEPQYGRKWYISQHCCISEIVQTALMAIIAFEEHEVREHFTYFGEKVYGPHIAVNMLATVSRQKDVRLVKGSAREEPLKKFSENFRTSPPGIH